MSNPVEGGRPLLRGRLFGFPVQLDISFVIIMAILGYAPGVSLQFMLLWLLITPLAVLIHELGHAVAARANGAHPQIALAGFGGVTTYATPRPLDRVRSLAISLAGPFVGLVTGFALLGVRLLAGDGLSLLAWQALQIGIWTCVGWSVLNLLPILPLDGGQAMRELLPGEPRVRARRAAGVSVLVAAVAAVVAYVGLGQVFLAVFLLFFLVTNVLALRGDRRAAAPLPGGPAAAPIGTGGVERAVVARLWSGQAAEARQLLESLPPGTPVDLAVHGAVLALTGDPAQGHALLEQELARRPGEPNVLALRLLTAALEHDWDAVTGTLQGPLGAVVPAPVVARAIEEARGTGREDVAGRLEAMVRRPADTP